MLVTPVGVKLVNPAVPLMLVGVVKPASAELCQFTTVPTLPLKVKAEIVPPTQIVWFELTVPPTDNGFTVMVAELEFAVVQLPLCTTAR